MPRSVCLSTLPQTNPQHRQNDRRGHRYVVVPQPILPTRSFANITDPTFNPTDVRLFLPATCAYVPTLVLEVWAAGKLVGAASLNGEELVASANIMRLNASVMHPSALGAGLKQRPGQRATPHKVTTKALDSGGALIGISTALKDFPEHLAAVAPKHAKPKLKVRAYSA